MYLPYRTCIRPVIIIVRGSLHTEEARDRFIYELSCFPSLQSIAFRSCKRGIPWALWIACMNHGGLIDVLVDLDSRLDIL